MSVQYSCKRYRSRPLTILALEPALPEAPEAPEIPEASDVSLLQPWIIDSTSHQPTITTIQPIPEIYQTAIVTKPEPVFKSTLCQFDTMMLEEQNGFMTPDVSRSDQQQEQTELLGLLSFRQALSLIVSAALVLGWVTFRQQH